MHELSITQSIVELVENTAAQHEAAKVRSVKVRVGALTCIQPDALTFCFDILKEGTLLEEAELLVETVPVKLACPNCRHQIEAKLGTACPVCRCSEMTVVEGKEFYVESIDIDG